MFNSKVRSGRYLEHRRGPKACWVRLGCFRKTVPLVGLLNEIEQCPSNTKLHNCTSRLGLKFKLVVGSCLEKPRKNKATFLMTISIKYQRGLKISAGTDLKKPEPNFLRSTAKPDSHKLHKY